jgi:nitrate reductase gamma subunit
MQKPEEEAACRTCHARGNTIGAVAMVLPAKSIICMPCHTATFAIGDTITVLSFILFLFGFAAVGSVWISGNEASAGAGRGLKKSIKAVLGSLFSSQLFAIVKSIILDGLLQRRLFSISKERWLLHALIFYPFIFRFTWGMMALLASLWWPEWPETWIMLDKNHPLTAFLFDISGLIVIVGIVGMLIRRLQKRADQNLSGLPPADWAAYALLGGIIIGGFILEGMRMAMTGSPGGAPYAFVGDAISRMLTGFELTHIYGYLWYLHAILTGAFVVYLPFSRMFHIIMAPVSLAMNAAAQKHS